MQDMDLYTGKQNSYFVPQFDTADPDYFARAGEMREHDAAKSHTRATRLIAFVAALCIISFTTGLVTGIRFAGGKDKPLIDPHTKQAVSSLGQRVTGAQPAAAAEPDQSVSNAKSYPKADFPWVIRIGNEFSKDKVTELANALSAMVEMQVQEVGRLTGICHQGSASAPYVSRRPHRHAYPLTES